MRINKDNAAFSQNNFNYYIGSIDTTETILIDSSFIIIGNVKTSKNILAECNLIVMGDIDAKSIYTCKDLLCTGNVNTEISEVEGELKILQKNILNKNIISAIHKSKKDSINEVKLEEINKDYNSVKSDKKEIHKKNIQYKRITVDKDLNEGDIVIHNSLGEGKFISICENKIKIDFNTKGIRNISKSITYNLGLLKKELKNGVYNNKRENLSKKEYINKIDKLIDSCNENNFENDSNNKLCKLNMNSLKEKEAVCSNNSINNIENKFDSKNINSLYKNKSISFYVKDINSYIIDEVYDCGRKSEIHYIKYNNHIYIRLSQICELLNVYSNIFDTYISYPIKITYYGKNINGIKFIKINDILDNKNFIKRSLEYNNKDGLPRYEMLIQILEYIKYDCDTNLENSIPYLRYIINDILNSKKLSIEELAREWKVSVENIEIIRLGFVSPLSKVKKLIKDNKIENCQENQYKIREIKSQDINIKPVKEYNDKENDDLDEKISIKVDQLEVITNSIYQMLDKYDYDIDDVNIKNIDMDINDTYLIDIEIKDLKSVSSTISLMDYLSLKISELTKERVKINLSEFDKRKFISEIIEVGMDSIKVDIYNNKCDIIIDIYDYDIKETLLEENKDYIRTLTGMNIELVSADKKNNQTKISTNKTVNKKELYIETLNYDSYDTKLQNKDLRLNKDLKIIGKEDISRLLLSQNIAFKNEQIMEFECGKIKKSYYGYTFDYVKYNGKMYIRAGQIGNILNLDINKLYPYLEESIKIRYVDSFVSNAKFSSLKSILKAINKVQYMYPDERLSENKIDLIRKCVDILLKDDKKINDNIPYWSLVLDYMMFDLKISIDDLELKWGISGYDIELMTLGFSPSKSKTKTLIKEEIKI